MKNHPAIEFCLQMIVIWLVIWILVIGALDAWDYDCRELGLDRPAKQEVKK